MNIIYFTLRNIEILNRHEKIDYYNFISFIYTQVMSLGKHPITKPDNILNFLQTFDIINDIHLIIQNQMQFYFFMIWPLFNCLQIQTINQLYLQYTLITLINFTS
ncbi:hypothetical protein pb186bvf_007616 [Paramecium bursaria]